MGNKTIRPPQVLDEDQSRWTALARLMEGNGTFDDFQDFAKDFRDNHLSPELIHITTLLWLDAVLKSVSDGATPPKPFGAKKSRGAKPKIENKCAITAYVRLRERLGSTNPVLDAEGFFGLDQSNIRKNLIDGWGESLPDDQLQMIATTWGNPGD